jgi:hypothetical protein
MRNIEKGLQTDLDFQPFRRTYGPVRLPGFGETVMSEDCTVLAMSSMNDKRLFPFGLQLPERDLKETAIICVYARGFWMASSDNASYILSWNGQELLRLSGMYIPDQFWKHYKAEILTTDQQLIQRMKSDEQFWDEHLILRRESDSSEFHINVPETLAIFSINQASLLKEHGEIALRGF